MFEHVTDLDQTDPELAAIVRQMRKELRALGERLRVTDNDRQLLAWTSALCSVYAGFFAAAHLAYPGSEEKAVALIDAIHSNITEAMGQWLTALPQNENGMAIYAPGD